MANPQHPANKKMTGILSVLGRAAFCAPGVGLLKRIDPTHWSRRPGSPGRSPQVGPGLPILRVGLLQDSCFGKSGAPTYAQRVGLRRDCGLV